MPIGSHAFWLPRKGHSPAEYEDAFAVDDGTGRYAVADGASEGCFTDLWARFLVEDFVHQANGIEQWFASLPAIQQRWDADVRARRIPWHAAPGVEQGAYAAFLGFLLENSPLSPAREEHGARVTDSPHPLGEGQGVRAYHWQAVAIGDTCLFHTRDGLLLRAFPLAESKQFGNAPKLVGARMSSRQIQEKQRLWTDGVGQPGDRLWAMTDALARWCLVEHEANRNPWLALESFIDLPSGRGAGGEGNSFPAWIAGLRDSGNLHNDDVTLLAIIF